MATAHSQKPFVMLAECSIAQAAPAMVQFAHSAVPFCCGVCGVISSCAVPFSSKYLMKSVDRNSPLRSERMALSVVPN